jgi:hypothetical protein
MARLRDARGRFMKQPAPQLLSPEMLAKLRPGPLVKLWSMEGVTLEIQSRTHYVVHEDGSKEDEQPWSTKTH